MKRLFALIILVPLFLMMISCGKATEIIDTDTEINFLGNTFTVYSQDMWLYNKKDRVTSASIDRFISRIEETEKEYNVKIRNEVDNIETKILALTLNGGSGCDMFFCGNDHLFTFFNLGILTPFSEIEVKNHQSEKFGIPSLLVEGTFGGTQYGIINYFGDSIPTIYGLMQINEGMLNSLSLTDPHEYVEQGEWTWDNLHRELIKGTFSDGESEHIGMLSERLLGGIHAFLPAIISNGGHIIKYADGIYETGLDDEKSIEAIEFMTELYNEGLISIVGGDAWLPWLENGNWLFVNDVRMTGTSDRVIVRFPYGPSGNPDIVAAYSMNRDYYAFSLMLSVFESSDIGIIVDDLFEPLDASIYPEGWKDYAIENLFYSDSDYETFMTGLNTLNYYPIGVLYGTNMWNHTGEIEDALYRILEGHGSAQSEINAIKETLNNMVNKSLNNIE